MEYSVFIDEAGDTGTDSEYYMLTLVFHNQNASLESNIAAYESRLTSTSLPNIPFHMQPLNEQYLGEFTDGDRVMIGWLRDRLFERGDVADSIKHDGSRIFTMSTLPKVFGEEARRAYVENTEAFTSLFEDDAKYNAIMKALGEALVAHYS